MAASLARLRTLTAPGFRTRFSAVFGILALFSMMALATWHDSLPHVDTAESSYEAQISYHDHATNLHELVAGHHDHGSQGHHDIADMMHVAAHGVFQNIAVPAQPLVGAIVGRARDLWLMGPPVSFDSFKLESLLRPPRG